MSTNMSTKNNVPGKAIAFLLLIIICMGVFIYYKKASAPIEAPLPVNNEIAGTSTPITGAPNSGMPPVFTWVFEEDDSLNPDGNPQINVYLEAKYSDGHIVRKKIDTSHGGCNELADVEGDRLQGSIAVQCYGAGFGYRFKIVKGNASYLVQKQEFEEGAPDYDPPHQEFKTVSEFPFSGK